VIDSIIQEVDIQTGQVLWEWHSLGHIPLRASHEPPRDSGRPWDYFHLNSIQRLPSGNLLISARNTWAVYAISKHTGEVLWTLGGKHPSFKMGPGTNFEWQHDARMHPGGILSLFNDAALPQEEAQSSAMWLRLTRTPGAMSASLVRRVTHSPPLLSSVTGNVQTLPDGNSFVGWGSQPDFSEYTPSGRQIFNGSLPLGMDSYRALRFRWSALPATRPAMATRPGPQGSVSVYASWNGATGIKYWRVLGGPRPDALARLGQARSQGFETRIRLPNKPRYLAVQALDAHRHVLGSSQPQPDSPHAATFGPGRSSPPRRAPECCPWAASTAIAGTW
jgi:hypothetical protein